MLVGEELKDDLVLNLPINHLAGDVDVFLPHQLGLAFHHNLERPREAVHGLLQF